MLKLYKLTLALVQLHHKNDESRYCPDTSGSDCTPHTNSRARFTHGSGPLMVTANSLLFWKILLQEKRVWRTVRRKSSYKMVTWK